MTPAVLINLWCNPKVPMRTLDACVGLASAATRLSWLMFARDYKCLELARAHCECCPDCNLEKAS